MAWSCCVNRWHKLVLAALLNHFRHFWRQSLTLWWVYLRCSWKRIVGMVESQSNSSSALRRNCEWELFFQLFGPLLDPEKRLKHTDSDRSHLRLSLAIEPAPEAVFDRENHQRIGPCCFAGLLWGATSCVGTLDAIVLVAFTHEVDSSPLNGIWSCKHATTTDATYYTTFELYDMCVLHCFAICECVCSILQHCNKSSLLWVGII